MPYKVVEKSVLYMQGSDITLQDFEDFFTKSLQTKRLF